MILIAGPCVVENKIILKQSIEYILEAIEGKDIDFIFKSSFLKDNRTLYSNYRGLSTSEALGMLGEIKKEYGVKICSDIHNSNQLLIDEVKDIIDVIQIPAFLAKQQLLMQSAVTHCILYNKTLHIKKPQFIGPNDMLNIINNVKHWGAKNIIATDRGTMFGYDKVFMDPRHISIMKKSEVPILWDITHPNKGLIGNQTKRIETLGMTAIVNGANGLFLETHPNCREAKCDGLTMLYSQELKQIIDKFYSLWEYTHTL